MRTATCFVMTVFLAVCLSGNTVSAGVDKRPTERASPAPEVNPNAVMWRRSAPPANPRVGDVWVNPKDGAEMVYVPASEFILGSSDTEIDTLLREYPRDTRELFEDEQPQCRVQVPAYWIARSEVTNGQYLRFVKATHRHPLDYWTDGNVPSGLENFPVVNVNWDDARAYARWVGGRLPTELEWEKAARGTDGRLFPWGQSWDKSRCQNLQLRTKVYRIEGGDVVGSTTEFPRDPIREGPVAVGSYPAGASPYGCLDMAGNVWEWCEDCYDAKAYQRYSHGNIGRPSEGNSRVVRGGSWYWDHPAAFRCAFRHFALGPGSRLDELGFRCVRPSK